VSPRCYWGPRSPFRKSFPIYSALRVLAAKSIASASVAAERNELLRRYLETWCNENNENWRVQSNWLGLGLIENCTIGSSSGILSSNNWKCTHFSLKFYVARNSSIQILSGGNSYNYTNSYIQILSHFICFPSGILPPSIMYKFLLHLLPIRHSASIYQERGIQSHSRILPGSDSGVVDGAFWIFYLTFIFNCFLRSCIINWSLPFLLF
jgi:hypothetical protein